MAAEIGQRGLGNHAETGTKAERVLQAARDDAIGDTDVDDIGQLIARRRLGGGEADVAGIAADDAGNACGIHLLDFGRAALGRRLRVAEHGIDLAEPLDAAGGIDLLDSQGCAEPALLTRVGQRACDRVQHAKFHRAPLRAQNGRHGDGAGCRRRGAERGRGEKLAAIK